MGQKLYFDNYTAAGDILLIAICFVIGILVATSYNTRTHFRRSDIGYGGL